MNANATVSLPFGASFLLLAVLALPAPSHGWGVTAYVDAQSSNPVEPYTTWATAARDIESAVSYPFTTNVIVANGTYYPVVQIEVYDKHVHSLNGPAYTIVDGSLQPPMATVFYLNGTNSLIQGFTITGSAMRGVYLAQNCGTVRDCIVENNHAPEPYSAAGIMASGPARIHDTIVRNNTAETGIAGMVLHHNGFAAPFVSNCVISGNQTLALTDSPGGLALYGGGHVVDSLIVSNRAGDPVFPLSGQGGGVSIHTGGMLERCRISGNQAGGAGGGVLLAWGAGADSVVLKDCIVSNNFCNGIGGGVYIYNGGTLRDSLIVDNVCTSLPSERVYGNGKGGGLLSFWGGWCEGTVFRGNRAHNGAGVYVSNGGTMRGCRFIGNEAIHAGGGGLSRVGVGIARFNVFERGHFVGNVASNGAGLYAQEGTNTQVRSSIVNGNQALGTGGGVYAAGAALQNCTIAGNAASVLAGGVWSDGLTVENTILYDNAAPAQSNWYRVAAGTWNHCCTVPAVGAGAVATPPAFVNAANGDYRLSSSSPCIDAGIAIPAVTADYHGVAMPLDGDGSGTAAYDVGACEFIHASADTDGDGFGDTDEWVAGTDGTQASSFFRIEAVGIASAALHVDWLSAPSRLYTIQAATNLAAGGWSNCAEGTDLPGSGEMMSYREPACAGAGRFYRVLVRLPE